MKKQISALAASLLAVSSMSAFAAPGFITGETYEGPGGSKLRVTEVKLCRDNPIASAPDATLESNTEDMAPDAQLDAIDCNTQKGIKAGLAATTAMFGIAGACSAPLPPVAIGLAGATALVGVVTFTVEFMPCEDKMD